MGGVRVLLEELWEDALVWESTSDREGISHDRPLGLSVQRHDLAHIVDEPNQMEPVLVWVGFSDSLRSLEAMKAIGKISLRRGGGGEEQNVIYTELC